MLFNSIDFLVFLPLVFAVYWSLNSRLKLQNLFLLLASYVFYGRWDYRFLSLIIISSFVDYWIGKTLHKEEDNNKRKALLIASLTVNLGFLMVFKYYNFFVESFIDFASALGFQANINTLKIILPVGISFYTFQTLSYTIDVYRRRLKPTDNLINFFTYVAFFPQLVAGPIERASRLLPQIEKPRTFDYFKAKDGLRQILWGFFKKVVIADNCAVFVDPIFANYTEVGSATLVLGTVLFAFQIYCDFSGYSDIAIGTARLFGIDLMQNFATPYFARDIAEFWRRWHISLSTWFRDYLYIPLGGSRVTKVLQLRNVMAIFLVSGFWHGANWTFIIWGFIHALCYIPQIFFNTNRKYLDTVAEGRWLPNFRELFNIILTFIIVDLAWIFFRAPSLEVSLNYIGHIFSKGGNFSLDIASVLGLNLTDLQLLAVFITIMLVIEWLNRTSKHGLEVLPKFKVLRYLIYLGLSLLVVQYFYGESDFIYFQF